MKASRRPATARTQQASDLNPDPVSCAEGEDIHRPGETTLDELGTQSKEKLSAFVEASAATNQRANPESDRLSNREREVLAWIADGKTTSEVGVILGISAHTVGEHLKNIRRKLQSSNNAHSVLKALQSGQLQIGDM